MTLKILFSGINKDIWVVGSPIIQRTGEHSKIRPTGTSLQQLGCQLVWVGMPGMRWENVTLSIFYCSIRNNWIGHSNWIIESSDPK
jgi:hypothetical protein